MLFGSLVRVRERNSTGPGKGKGIPYTPNSTVRPVRGPTWGSKPGIRVLPGHLESGDGQLRAAAVTYGKCKH